VGLVGPNSLAVSSDGRNVYATAVTSDAVTVFRRDPATGALSQAADGSGCIAGGATPGCTTGRALDGPAVVVVSPDGRSAYVGSFSGNAVAVFDRSASSGALTQLPGIAGCVVDAPADGCTTGLGLAGPEGMAVSPDGGNVYVASALSGTIGVFARDPSSGALVQEAGGGGCIADVATAGCTTGKRLGGADAVAMSADGGQVYVTSLSSQSLTTFSRAPGSGLLTQQAGTAACVIDVLAVGCSLGRSLAAPEGVAVSPDGAGVYVAAFGSGAVVILDRSSATGAVLQKPRLAGCVVTRPAPDCMHGRALLGAGGLAISPDGRYVYAAGFTSDAVTVFKRVARGDPELRRNGGESR
jgi:DNA-binding beta-propeller fold protein YncE